MIVVNFLCRRGIPMMKNKVKITAAVSVAIISLLIVPLHNQSPQEPPVPHTSPASASLRLGRDKTPPSENKALAGEKTAEISTQNPPQDNTPTESNSEPPNPAEITVIFTVVDAPRDNPTPTSVPSKNTTSATVCVPKMGNTRTVDGQKQIYFLGFGWIDDNDEPNECIYVEDMYENGNKIGSMGGGTFVDGDGDINKMVGTMD